METVTSAQMKALEAAANAKGLSYDEMMLRAGKGVADHTNRILLLPGHSELFEEIADYEGEWGGEAPVAAIVLIGPGNNGGDGLVCATALAGRIGAAYVHTYIWKRKSDLANEKDWPLKAAFAAGVVIHYAKDDPEQELLKSLLLKTPAVVDAIFGTGQRGPFPDDLLAILRTVVETQESNNYHIIVIDIPTGIDADTGEAITPNYVKADLTCTFAYPKPGLLQGKGREAAGEVEVLNIGFGEVGVNPASI